MDNYNKNVIGKIGNIDLVSIDPNAKFVVNKQGGKVFFNNPEYHAELPIPSTYEVLSIGMVQKKFIVTVNEADCVSVYRLPDRYFDWAMQIIAAAHMGNNPLPTKITFLKNGGNLTVFIDESGNAGDVKFDVNSVIEQPFFALGAVGIRKEDEEKLAVLIKFLKDKHKVQSEELKSKTIYNKQKFVLDLVTWLDDEKIPVFVELMDKRFYLVTQMLENVFFCNSLEQDEFTLSFRHSVSDYLIDRLPDEAYYLFSEACKNETLEAFEKYLYFMKRFIESDIWQENSLKSHEKVLLSEELSSTIEIYEERKGSEEKFYLKFLPSPDYDLKNKAIKLLPHIPSLANICYRVEKYKTDLEVDHVEFVHDEQKHFASILQKNIELIPSMSDIAPTPSGQFKNRISYNIRNEIDMKFQNSKDSLGIQIADVIAGVVMRAWKDYIIKRTLHDSYKEIFKILISMMYTHPSFGVNFVVEKPLVDEFSKYIFD